MFSKAKNYLENKSDEPTNPHMSYWNLKRKFCLQDIYTRTQPDFNIWVSPSSIKWLRNVWNVPKISEKSLFQYFSDRSVCEIKMFFFYSFICSHNKHYRSLSSIVSAQFITMKSTGSCTQGLQFSEGKKCMQVATTQRNKLIREI